MVEKGIVFLEPSNIDLILEKMGWDEKKLKQEKCAVCDRALTKENIGGFTKESPIRGICRDFPCIMTVLLETKKEALK